MVTPLQSWIESVSGLQNSRKLSNLTSMSEDEFREDVLVPLLRKMGYTNVTERHGPAEYGKDITFVEETPLGRRNCAVVAKAGDISGAASGKQNLSIVMAQVDQALELAFHDVERKTREVVSHVIVWASGKISNSAETQIVDAVSAKYRNVSFKTGQATVELLDTHIPTFFAVGDAYVSDYYSNAKEFYARWEELHTLGASSDKYRLPAMFVPPVLRPYIPRLKNSKLNNKHYQFGEILEMQENLLIAGQMGAGKSSLLRRFLLAMIERNESEGTASPIPVILRAKDLDLRQEECLETAIAAEISRFSPHSDPASILPEGPDSGVIVLLDGVDELKDERLILDALANVSRFAARYPGSRTVVTMRSMDILESPEVLADFLILEIEELSRSQIVTFIDNWFGKDSPVGARLTQFLRDPNALHGLPGTPLTLAIVVILYASGVRELPANLTELFSKYVELALGRWDEAKGMSHQFEWRVKEFLIRGLAWSMHQTRVLAISPQEVDNLTLKLGEDRGLEIDPILFRAEVDHRSELLILDEDGRYEFKHRAFQDYFVGTEIVSRAKAIDIVVENFLDPWWETAVFFACGLRPESEDLLDSIMSNVNPSGTSLYSFAINLGMATQASYLAPRESKRQAVLRILDSLIEAWGAVAEDYASMEEKPQLPAFLSPHLLLVGVFTGAAHQSLGSITLAPVLRDTAVAFLEADLASMSTDDRTILEWKAFFLAVGLAASGEVDHFAAFLERNLIRDPVLQLAASFPIYALKDQPWLTSQSNRILRRLEKRIKKSASANSAYIKSLSGSDPIPLLPARDEGQSGVGMV